MKSGERVKLIFIVLLLVSSACSIHAQLTIQNGVVLKSTGNAIITLRDIDLVNNGSINQQPGDGRFVFSGSSDNSISGTNGPLFDIFEIGKTGSAKVSLGQDFTIGNSIVFSGGLVDLNGHNILLQPGAILTGENETSRLVGTNGGYVEITANLNAPASMNAGNLGAVISSSQNLGNTVLRRGHALPANGSDIGTSINRYYDILPANNNALNATLRFNYLDAECNGQNEAGLTLWKSTDTLHWTNQLFSTRDTSSNYVEKTGLSDFSRWTLSATNNALPVSLSSFIATCENGSALITWKTMQEQNSSHFNLQKSRDGIAWQVVAQFAAAGNSAVEKSYSYTDINVDGGKILYRLVEQDLNGLVNYSPVAALTCGVQDNALSIHPNPVRDMLWISARGISYTISGVQVLDSKGTVVSVPITNPGNNREYGINMQNLPSGLYLVVVKCNGGNKINTTKVVKQ